MQARLALGAILFVFLALELPTVAHLGISWDEQTDIDIAASYLVQPAGWLVGSEADAINARLPMFSTAVVFALFGGPSLAVARLVSVAVSVFTLLAVFLFCRDELDRRKGLLACAILATSPYFLAYSKVAFTEGDAFITCGVAWVLVSLARLRRQRSLGWGAVTGIALGIALASKISAVAVVPVVFLTLLLPTRGTPTRAEAAPTRVPSALAGLLAAGGFAIAGGWWLGAVVGNGSYDGAGLRFLAAHAGIVVALWLAALAVTRAQREARLDPGSLVFIVMAFAGLTFFVLPPVHITNVQILRELVAVFFFGNFESPGAFALEAAAQNLAVVVVKPSFVIGVSACVAVAVAAFRFRSREELRLPLLIFACYLLFLIRLPWAQTFYMMPAFPMMAILLADLGVELFDRKRTAALALAAAAAAFLTTDLWRSYPDLHLNGYQWVGARSFAGRPTLGPRSLVQLPADGVEQTVRWIDEHAQPGDSVVLFIRPLHIVEAVAANPRYQIVNGLSDPAAIEAADFVVTTLASEIAVGYGTIDPADIFVVPYDTERLRDRFTPVFTVTRAFDLEVAAVWQRKAGRP